MPATHLTDERYGTRQQAFRERIVNAGVTVQWVKSPDRLELLLFQALKEMEPARPGQTDGNRVPRARRAPVAGLADECPYPGLAAFTADETRWYWGREELLADLTGLLASRPGGPIVVVASSGAGKSSLLQAGLMPALVRGVLPQPGSRHWSRRLFTPTAHPMAALSAELAAITEPRAGGMVPAPVRDPSQAAAVVRATLQAHGGLILVIDQFEEAFALCDDLAERTAFMETIGAICEAGCLTVLSLRADFYQQAVCYPLLRTALRDRQVVMGPMSAAELRKAIICPGQDAGLELEPGLVELLVRDLGGADGPAGGSSYDAGRLPLLAHALRATWQQRQGKLLTVAGYLATGGIRHAIATTAERTFGQLTEAEQSIARLVFLRLVKIGDGGEDTRRAVAPGTLAADAQSAAVVETFTRARLLTRERDAVEIAHEALLREWPRLRDWIDSDRAGRLVQQDIEDHAAAWENAGREASRLFRGAQLVAAATWAAHGELTSPARTFLAASVKQRRRAAQVRQLALTVLVVLALAASSLIAFAIAQRKDAARSRDLAMYAAISQEAENLTTVNPSLAAEFDIAAYRVDPTAAATYTNLLTTEQQGLATALRTGPAALAGLGYSPNGRILAAAAGRVIRLWDTTDQQHPTPIGAPLPGVTAGVEDFQFIDKGRVFAAGLSDGMLQFWDIADPARPVKTGAISIPGANGKPLTFVSYSDDVVLTWIGGALEFWNISKLQDPVRLSKIKICSVQFYALSWDSKQLAFGCSDGKAYLMNTADPSHPRVQASITASSAGSPITLVSFSPTGNRLITAAYDDDSFMVWDIADPRHPARLSPPENDFDDSVTWAEFSPDNSLIVTADQDGTLQLWEAADPDGDPIGPPMSADSGPAVAAVFSPSGQTIASRYANGNIRIWTVPHPAFSYRDVNTAGLAFNSTGHLIAISSNMSGALQLWQISHGSKVTRLANVTPCQGADLQKIAFSPTKAVLAIGCAAHGYLRLWNTAQPSRVRALSPPLLVGPASAVVNTVAFDKTGDLLAAGDTMGEATIWNVVDPAHPVKVGQFRVGPANVWVNVALSPDGHVLAAGTRTTTRLWDISDPARPRQIGVPLRGPTQNLTSLAFSPTGTIVAGAGQDDDIYLWKAEGPQAGQLATAPLAGHTDLVSDIAFSPDGRLIASSSDDDTVRLWNVAVPASATAFGGPLTGHTDYVVAVAFSPRGHLLASLGNDQTLYLWHLNINYAISRICAYTSGVLTPSVWRHDLPGVPYQPPCSDRT